MKHEFVNKSNRVPSLSVTHTVCACGDLTLPDFSMQILKRAQDTIGFSRYPAWALKSIAHNHSFLE
jgi:hypothetical protein